MKPVHTSPERSYRGKCRPRAGETAFQVVLEQSDLHIVTRPPPIGPDMPSVALRALTEARQQVHLAIALQPEFAASFSPLPMPPGASLLVRRMVLAAARCGVGPMAAVAGAVAQAVAEALAAHSSEVLVENGGDLHLISSTQRTIGLLADPDQDAALGLILPAEAFPVSLCSSSASIGHSISLGQGELVVVRSPDACFADAAATALCNLLHTADDLELVLARARAWSRPDPDYPEEFRLQGVFAQCQGSIALWGELELTAL